MAQWERKKWFTRWCEPVIVALYAKNAQAVEEALLLAEEALAAGSLSIEDNECLRCQLTYLEFQAVLALKPPGDYKKRLCRIAKELAKNREVFSADKLRSRLHLQLRILLDRTKIEELRPAEFGQLLEAIPEEEYTTELWHYVSGWAFVHEQSRYLAQAYEFALLQGRGFNVEWTWQRMQVMLKLVRGDAKRDDLLWLIDRAQIKQQLGSLNYDILPKAAHLGLVDDVVEEQFEERRELLSAQNNARLSQLLESQGRASQSASQQAY